MSASVGCDTDCVHARLDAESTGIDHVGLIRPQIGELIPEVEDRLLVDQCSRGGPLPRTNEGRSAIGAEDDVMKCHCGVADALTPRLAQPTPLLSQLTSPVSPPSRKGSNDSSHAVPSTVSSSAASMSAPPAMRVRSRISPTITSPFALIAPLHRPSCGVWHQR